MRRISSFEFSPERSQKAKTIEKPISPELYYDMDLAIPKAKRAGDGALAEWYGRRLFWENLNKHQSGLPLSSSSPSPPRQPDFFSQREELNYTISFLPIPFRDIGKTGLAWLGRLEMKSGEARLNGKYGRGQFS